MAVTSRLVVNGNSAAGFQTVYTVPPGRTLILRRGVLLNAGVAAAAGWYTSAGGVVGWLSPLLAVPLNDVRESGYAILNPGHLLGVYAATATFTYHASGSLLVGAPV